MKGEYTFANKCDFTGDIECPAPSPTTAPADVSNGGLQKIAKEVENINLRFGRSTLEKHNKLKTLPGQLCSLEKESPPQPARHIW
mmetsp:Transcript_40059/g.73198  ORF Transcript_40059/g.73198 Transcript_40059/m.73198 type:complete len:85 (-) Transcript_40059:204-458(-)